MKIKQASGYVRISFAVVMHAIAITACAVEFERGRDLLPVFARAHAGLPLRAAAIGGSITQAGSGWIGPWLQEQFPKTAVTMHNAGMSATGSQLGIFRLERDVISAQPDLVLIEFAVNDGGLTDEDAIRYNESIVVRLKSLPHPPAVVFIEAAARGGSKRIRHQRVAKHYGLLDIDLQVALDEHLKATDAEWTKLMSDNVHPNEAGHAFYAQTIAKHLAPFVAAAKSMIPNQKIKLPAPLSAKPLLLDGRLVPLAPQAGWRKEHSLPHWWDMFFTGVISADKPGTELVLPARGTTIGLFFALEKDSYGSFYVNVDGDEPRLVDTSVRGGYTYIVLGQDLSPQEHLLRLAVANPIGKDSAPVKLGYLLAAGESGCEKTLAPQGRFNPGAVATRTFAPIPAKDWEWSGPYGGAEKTVDPTADLHTAFPPEIADRAGDWKPLEGAKPVVDFAKLTGRSDRGVCYARMTLQREQAEEVMLALRIDYFGKLWVNGELVRTIDGGHGHPNTPMLIPVKLRAGANAVLIKVHSGSLGNQFAMAVEE
jgi:lysophospholipase L1-like esterase